MKIRKATVKDIKKIIEMDYKLFSKFRKLNKIDTLDKSYWFSKKQTSDIKKEMKNKDYMHFIAEEDNKIIGYSSGSIFKNYQIYRVKLKGNVETLFVQPSYRRKGVGRALVKELFKWFKSKGMKHFTVGTHALDKEANSF